jgi:hypothetical protein
MPLLLHAYTGCTTGTLQQVHAAGILLMQQQQVCSSR